MGFEFVCGAEGPTFQTGATAEERTFCTRQRGHTLQHEWWNDDGSIRLTWWDGYVFGDGRWRQQVAGEED